MPDIETLRRYTADAAGRAYADGVISKSVLHRLQDGTVSSYDLEEANKLRAERYAIYKNMSKEDPRYPEAQKKLNDANRLWSSIRDQYENQGYAESAAENTRDWYNGGEWK